MSGFKQCSKSEFFKIGLNFKLFKIKYINIIIWPLL